MPWEVADVDQHKKGLTESQKQRWVEVANDALARCLREGGEDCEAAAIQQASTAVEESMHEHESLAERILDAVFDESATFKAQIQAFLKAAKAVTSNKAVPKKVKDKVEEMRRMLASNTWADLSAEPAKAAPSTESAGGGKETAPQPITEAGAIIATFTEDGALVTTGGQA